MKNRRSLSVSFFLPLEGNLTLQDVADAWTEKRAVSDNMSL